MERTRSLEQSGMRQDPVTYLVSGKPLNIPARLEHENDILGLYDHHRVREAVTEAAFERLDYTAGQVMAADPKARSGYLKAESVHVATLSLGPLHTFEVRRSHGESSSICYTVDRTDKGSEQGGFSFIRNADGAVLFRLKDLETFDPESDEYLEALGQASRFIEVFASHYGIPLGDHKGFTTTDESYRRLLENVERRSKGLYKAASKVRYGGEKSIELVKKAFTHNTEAGRKPAWGRLALVAALMPAPGYSGRLIEAVPIPRPASIEAASDIFHGLTDEELSDAERARHDYQRGDDDIPDLARVIIDGTNHPLPLISSVPSEVVAYGQNVEVRAWADNVYDSAEQALVRMFLNLKGIWRLESV